MSKVKFVTPAGIAQYPWLQPHRPDTAFDAAGKWKVNLLLTPDESKALMDIVTSAKNENFAPKDVVRVPFKKDLPSVLSISRSISTPKVIQSQRPRCL